VDDKALVIRWRDEPGMRLAARVLDRIQTGQPLGDLPVGRHEGRIDLRGFAAPDPDVVPTGRVTDVHDDAGIASRLSGGKVGFHGVTLADLDLTAARLESLRFFDTTLRNCRFDNARCQDWSGWNLTVEDCSFGLAHLRGSALGTWYQGRGNRFDRVDFSGADLREISCQAASFTDCDFTDARLETVEFGACEFVRCRFGGLLDEVRFRAEPSVGVDTSARGRLEDVDFSAAILRWVEFRGLSLDQVQLPPEGDEHVLVQNYPQVVRHMVDLLADDHTSDIRRLRSRMQVELKRLDDNRDVGLWHRDELGETPQQQHQAYTLLHRAERDCSHTT
jgi:uncharacterized protein YjbI with pentapeptide repeats